MKGKVSILLISSGLLILLGVWLAKLSGKNGTELSKASDQSNPSVTNSEQMSMGARMLTRDSNE